jgi:hypothetical protein
MLCENARLRISGRTNLFYLPKYFRKGKEERDVLTLCAMRNMFEGSLDSI